MESQIYAQSGHGRGRQQRVEPSVVLQPKDDAFALAAIAAGGQRIFRWGRKINARIVCLRRKQGRWDRRRLSTMDKQRNVGSGWNRQLHGMVFAAGLIEFLELLAQPVRLDPCNGILTGIEGGFRAAKDLGCNVVFVELVDLAQEVFLAQIARQT